MIFADPAATVRLTVLPWIGFLVFVVCVLKFGAATGFGLFAGPSLGMLVTGTLIVVGSIVALAWITVGWHRYVLIGDRPELFGPKWRGAEIGLYVERIFWITLLMILPIVLLALVIRPITSAMLGGMGLNIILGATFAISMTSGVVLLYLWIRCALTLPAAALGNRMSVAGSWKATASIHKTIWLVALCLVFISMVVSFIPTLVAGGWPGEIFDIAVNGLFSLWMLSVLTTLYGTQVEHRPLAA